MSLRINGIRCNRRRRLTVVVAPLVGALAAVATTHGLGGVAEAAEGPNLPPSSLVGSVEILPVRGFPNQLKLRGNFTLDPNSNQEVKLREQISAQLDDVAMFWIDQSDCVRFRLDTIAAHVYDSKDQEIKEGGGFDGPPWYETNAPGGENLPVVAIHDKPFVLSTDRESRRFVKKGSVEVIAERLEKPACANVPITARFIYEHNVGKAKLTGVSGGPNSFGFSWDGEYYRITRAWTKVLNDPHPQFSWPVGGIATSATFRGSKQLHYFGFPAPSGNLAHWWQELDSWGEPIVARDRWVPGPGAIAGAARPPVAVEWGGTQHAVYATLAHVIDVWWDPSSGEIRRATTGTLGELSHEVGSVAVMVARDPGGAGLQLHAFTGRQDGHVDHVWRYHTPGGDRWDGDVWRTDGTAGIKGDSRPAAYAWYDQQHLFFRTKDDALGHRWWQPGFESPSADVLWANPGTVRSNPTGFGTGTQQHVFYVDANRKIAHVWWDFPGVRRYRDIWTPDDHAVGHPTSLVIGDRQICVYRSASGGLRAVEWTPAKGFRTIEIPKSLAHDQDGEVAATSRDGELWVFGFDKAGHLLAWGERSGVSDWGPPVPD